MQNKEKLNQKIAQLPTNPGVYFYKDKTNKIIYIGKALNINKRVKSYFFAAEQQTTKTAELLKTIEDVECLVTLDESDALILEDQLIKKHNPKYNVRLRDDKSYPYIKISSELFPRISITRELQDSRANYFGPYTSAKDTRLVLEMIRKHFPIRTSKMKLDGVKFYKPCLNFQLKRCCAPCNGQVEVFKYNQLVARVVQVLKGNVTNLIGELKEEMLKESTKYDFEAAAVLRDQIQTIQRAIKKQVVISKQKIHRDIIGISRKENLAGIQLLFVRSGVLLGSDFFYIQEADKYSEEELLRTVFSKLYLGNQKIIPAEVIIQFACNGVALEKYFAKKKKSIKIITPQKGEKKQLLKMCLENAEKNLTAKINQDKNHQQLLLEIQKKFRLNNIPTRIECYDISNIQGKSSAASMVVAKNGNLLKKDYRKFKIKTVAGIDDVASIREVLTRRFLKFQTGKNPLPDLLLIDGGKGQLGAVVKLTETMKIPTLDIIALAKGRSFKSKVKQTSKSADNFEYLLKPKQKNPIILPQNSPILLFFQKIRDEAHRFALSFHRQLRDKQSLASPLLAIRGISAGKRQKLLLHFKNIEQLKNASLVKIKTSNCVSEKEAEAIYNFFRAD